MCEKATVPTMSVNIDTKGARLPHKPEVVAKANVYTGTYGGDAPNGFDNSTRVSFDEVTLEQLELLQKLQLEWAKASFEMTGSS